MPDDRPLWTSTEKSGGLDVVGVGEISLDTVARVAHWPRVGDKAVVTTRSEHPGGQMATALLGCTRLGLRSALVGAVGDDAAAERALAGVVKAGIDVSGNPDIPYFPKINRHVRTPPSPLGQGGRQHHASGQELRPRRQQDWKGYRNRVR